MKTIVFGVALLAIVASANATMLTDGGFEDTGTGSSVTVSNAAHPHGTLISGWQYYCDRNGGTIGGTIDAANTAQHNVGSRSLKIDETADACSDAVYQVLTGFPNGTSVNWSYAVQATSLNASYWVEVGYAPVPDGTTSINPNSATGEVFLKKWANNGTTLTTGTWKTGSGSFTLSSTTTTVMFYVKLGGGGAQTAYFDNLTFTPEPVTLLMLGLPLVFVRRRRA